MAKYNSKTIILLLILAISFLFASFFPFNSNSLKAFAQSEPIELVDSGDLSQVQYVGDSLYMIDKDSREVIIYDLSDEVVIKKNTNLPNITNLQVLSDGSMFITRQYYGIYGVQEYEKDLDDEVLNLTNYQTTVDNQDIAMISDLVADFKSNLFALDCTSSRIYKKSSDSQGFEIYKNLDNAIVVDENSKLLSSYDGAILFVINSSSVWEITAGTCVEKLDISSFATNILDVKVDYMNNLYILVSGTEHNTLYFYAKNNEGNYVETDSEVLDINSFDINYEDGTIYAVKDNNLFIENIDFVQCLDTYVHSVDWKENVKLASGVEIAQVNVNTIIYKQPIDIISAGTLKSGSEFIILNKNIIDAPNYTYGLFDLVISGKRQLFGAYIANDNYSILSSNNEPPFANGEIINKAKLYKYPSTTIYSTANSQLVCESLNKGTAVTLIGTAYNYTDSSGLKFYQVQVDGGIGYILRSSVSQSGVAKSQSIPAPNARVKLPSDMVSLPVYNNSSADIVIAEVKDNQLLYMIEDTQNNGYIKVQYLDQTDNIVEGYVDVQYLSGIGISIYIVLGIGLLLVAVLITLIILYIKLKKHKKSPQTPNVSE